MNRKTPSFTFAFSMVQICYWMAACAIIGYAAVYLRALSFSSFSVGIITAAGEILGAVLGPVAASFLDRHPEYPTAKMNYPLMGGEFVLYGLLLFVGKNDLLTGAMYALLIGISLTINSVNIRFCLEAENAGLACNFGIARGMGSLAYILPGVLLGIIFTGIPERYLPAAGLIFLVLQILVNVYAGSFFRVRKAAVSLRKEEKSCGIFEFIRREPVFFRLLLGTSMLFFGAYTFETFLINVVRSVGGNTGTMGLLTGFMAAMELPAMFLFTRLRKRWKISALIRFSLYAFSARALAVAMASGVPGLFAAQLVQPFAYALYAPAIVEYVSAVIPEQNRSKGQSLVCTMELAGGIISGFAAGKLYDVTSVRNVLLAGFAVSAIGAVLAASGVKTAD